VKKCIVILAAILTMVGLTPSSAHVGANLRGFSDVAGQSSTVYLRLGHGCTDGKNYFGTSSFEVVVPIEAGTPRPSQAIDHGTFAEFAFQVRWSAAITAVTKVAFPTTQVCKRGLQDFDTKKKAPNDFFLKWIITDGSTLADTADTEFGPAPTVTVKPAA
jgi:hypothetical protein